MSRLLDLIQDYNRLSAKSDTFSIYEARYIASVLWVTFGYKVEGHNDAA